LAETLVFLAGDGFTMPYFTISRRSHFCFLMSKQNSMRFQYLTYRGALLLDLDRDSGISMLASRLSLKLGGKAPISVQRATRAGSFFMPRKANENRLSSITATIESG
jgi:hypothetical protein